MSKKVKRILVLGPGDSEHMQKIIKWYISGGFEVTFATLHLSSQFIHHYKGVDLIRLQYPWLKGRFSKLGYILAIPRMLTLRSDIVHAHYLTSYGFLSVFVRCQKRIISVWGSDILIFPKSSVVHAAFVKFILRRCDKVLSTSAVMVEELKKYTTNVSTNITPFGINLDLFPFVVRNLCVDETIYFGIVKSLKKVYRIDVFIRFIDKLRKRGIDCKGIIIGEGSERVALELLAEECDLQDHIRFQGFVENVKLPEYLREVHFGVYPSDSESFGVSVLEMNAMGIPCLVHDIGGLSDVVINGYNGFKFIPNDADELVKVFEQNILNKKLDYKDLAIGSRSFIEKNYSEKDCRMKFLSSLEN